MRSEVAIPPTVVTHALRGVEQNLPGAVETVWNLVYPWVVRRAHVLLRCESLRREFGSAEDLAHEAFLKLKPHHLAACRDRWHLIRIATRAMRQALVDCARRRPHRVPTTTCDAAARTVRGPNVDLDRPLDLAVALDELRLVNAQLSEVAGLHAVGGLSFVEVARMMGKSEAWARMNWQQAERWLRHRLSH